MWEKLLRKRIVGGPLWKREKEKRINRACAHILFSLSFIIEGPTESSFIIKKEKKEMKEKVKLLKFHISFIILLNFLFRNLFFLSFLKWKAFSLWIHFLYKFYIFYQWILLNFPISFLLICGLIEIGKKNPENIKFILKENDKENALWKRKSVSCERANGLWAQHQLIRALN